MMLAALLASTLFGAYPETQPYVAFRDGGVITTWTAPVTLDMVDEIPADYTGAFRVSSGETLLVIGGPRVANYSQLRQLWQFLSGRILHGNLDGGLTWPQLCYAIFIEGRTVRIGCGTCADLFFNIHAVALNGLYANRNKCNMFDFSILGLAPNGHTVNVFYCPDIRRDIVFDLDKAIIPMVEGAPAGPLDLARSHGQIDFAFARADLDPIVLAAYIGFYRQSWMCLSRDLKTAPYGTNFYVDRNLISSGSDVASTLAQIQIALQARWPSRTITSSTDWQVLIH